MRPPDLATASPKLRSGALGAFLAASWLVFTLPAPAHAAPCAGSELQGSVFHDFNADGVRSAGNVETGIFGATITAFSNDGSSTFCETLADGSFGIDAPSGGFPVRVEVTLPAGGGFDALEPGAAGLTTTFFASGATSGLDVGFNVPIDYCQANPDVIGTCFLHGDPLFAGSNANTLDTIISVDYDRTVPAPVEIALGGEVGAVWGLAYQKSSQSLFAAAVLKRHAGFGPLGIGGIYKVDFSGGTPVVSDFVDVTILGIPVGTDPRTVPGEDPPGNGATGNEPGLDNLTYEDVGKVGLGDIDVEEEAGRLWVMSLGDGTLYALDVGPDGDVPVSATAFPLPTVSCTDGVFRPWAVKSYRGRIYIGGVCSNENISPYPPPGGFIDFPNLVGYVYSMDPADGVFSLEVTVPLNYPKGCAGGGSGCQWKPWTDLSTASQVEFSGSIPSHPSPILSDLEFADDGDMIIGLSDRTGFQYGVVAPAPNTTPGDTSIAQVFAGGDMLRADFDPSTGAFTLESGGVAGGVAGAGAGNGQGPGGGEYYSASTAGFHFELSLGGYAVLRGSNHFVGSSMDPVTINSGGLLWMHELGATPGARFAGYTVYASGAPPTFAKGVGIGDVELRCDEAPIEIGNRVWCDVPIPMAGQMGDGIQNPGDPDVPLPGVTVDLSCDGGAVTASTVTAADGTYLFDDANVVGGIPPGATCTLSIDASQAALGECNVPTLVDAGGTDPGSDLRDSDGSDPDGDGIVEATVFVGGPGANDHSVDFGFMAPCDDTDGDRLCNESCQDDRDGDGIADCDDFDPQGYIYCEDSGQILPGGSVDVMGPGAVTIFEDGATGRYAFITDGTPGSYTLLVTPPASSTLSTTCLDLGVLDPTGLPDPVALGAGELGSSGFLGAAECAANPFYLTFDLEPGDPFIINNNIPMASCQVVPTEIPTASTWGMLMLAVLLAVTGAAILVRRH